MFKFLISLLLLCYKCSCLDVDDIQYDKMPPLFSLDDYYRCLLYNGTYCMVKVELSADPSNELMLLLQNYTLSSHIMHYNHTYLDKGLCIPTSCGNFIGNKSLDSQSDLQEILQNCQNATIFEEYGLEAKVSDVYYCDKPDKREKANLLDWSVLACFLLIIVVNISATIYDYKLDVDNKSREMLSKGERMLLCFSIRKNWTILTNYNKKSNFDGISFIRFGASLMMVMGHVVWIYTMGFIDNPHDFERSYSVGHFKIIYNGMIVVQIFFVISGFLMTYGLNLEHNKPSWKLIKRVIKMRYFRLVPSIAVMLAFTATWMRFLGSGPLWNRHVTPVVNDCRRWWWTHLLFINNYVQENKHCAVQTWHVAADMQLFLAFLAIFLLTNNNNRLNVMYIMLLISFLPPALHIFYQDLDALLLKNPEFLRTLDDKNFGAAYVFGHNSISCFTLGSITAFKLREWHRNGVVFKGKVYRFLFWLSVPAVIACFFAGSMFYEEDHRTPLWARVLFQSTHRLIVGLPIAVLIIGFAMNFDSVLEKFMQWNGFVVLGKLTYSVYILHMNFVPIIAGSKMKLEHFSYLSLIVSYVGIVGISFLISVPFYLMVEAPTVLFIEVLMSPRRVVKKGNKKLEQNEEQDKELDEGRKKLLEESILECNKTKKCD